VISLNCPPAGFNIFNAQNRYHINGADGEVTRSTDQRTLDSSCTGILLEREEITIPLKEFNLY
jgi:hypothetical protein